MNKPYYLRYFDKVEPLWSESRRMQFWLPVSAFRRVRI
jgi:hypothetical protein